MKKIFLITTLIFVAMVTQAQEPRDSWKIKFNSKLLLSTSEENETQNVKKIPATEWKKNGYLEINFKEAYPNTWKRSFLFFDETDEQILAKDSVRSVKLAVASLRKLYAGKKQVRIYTIIYPLNPDIAIRIRRVHLCTLQLP